MDPHSEAHEGDLAEPQPLTSPLEPLPQTDEPQTQPQQEKDQQNDLQEAEECKQQPTEPATEDCQAKPLIERSQAKTLELKQQGADHYTAQRFDQAIDFYDQALEHCPLEDSNMLAILNSNLAICYLKNEDYEGVVHYATEALKYDPLFKKALLNRAFCYERKDQIEEAFEDYKKLEELEPNNREYRKKRAYLQTSVEQLQEKRKTEVLSGLKDLGNTILGKFGMSLNNFKMEQNESGSYNIQYKP